MAIADRQQLSEIIDVADVLVRVSSQLRLMKAGKALRDLPAIQQAIDFLSAAIEGGQFMTTGTVGGLQSTLQPLTWVADVRIGSPSAQADQGEQIAKYQELVAFLGELRQLLEDVLNEQTIKDTVKADAAINFFKHLGGQLGIRADQLMRQSPSVLGISDILVGT